jgi:hypothetical protein
MRGEWRDCPRLADPPVLPPLAETLPDEAWPAATLELWEGWRHDGATTLWTPADFARAYDTIRLHAAGEKAAELRLREDSLGLSQKGKRDLRLRVVDATPQAEQAPAEVRRLRVVDL